MWLPVQEGALLPGRCWDQGFRAGASEEGAPPRRMLLEGPRAGMGCRRAAGAQGASCPGVGAGRREPARSPLLSGALPWQKREASPRHRSLLCTVAFSQTEPSPERWIWGGQLITEKRASTWNLFIKFPSGVHNTLAISQTRALFPKILKNRTRKRASDVPLIIVYYSV